MIFFTFMFFIHFSLRSSALCISNLLSEAFFCQLANAPDIWVVPYYVPAGLSISFVSPLLRPLSQSGRRRWEKRSPLWSCKVIGSHFEETHEQNPVETSLLKLLDSPLCISFDVKRGSRSQKQEDTCAQQSFACNTYDTDRKQTKKHVEIIKEIMGNNM